MVAEVSPVKTAVDSTSARAFNQLMTTARQEAWQELEVHEIMSRVGTWFMGRPYVAGTLDEAPYEMLVVRLDGFDCVTFVESVLALSRVIESGSYSYVGFEQHLESQRYRDGRRDGYCSRLHYFSEWIRDNDQRGAVVDITASIGGEVLEKQLDFMSSHRVSYRHLADDSLYAGIIEMERALQSETIYYIPQARIRSVYDQLRAGDIVALATDKVGWMWRTQGSYIKQKMGARGCSMHRRQMGS